MERTKYSYIFGSSAGLNISIFKVVRPRHKNVGGQMKEIWNARVMPEEPESRKIEKKWNERNKKKPHSPRS